MWRESATGGRAAGSAVAALARADARPATGRPSPPLQLLDLAALRQWLTDMPGGQEEREPCHRVAEERRADAAGDARHVAAGEPDRDDEDEHRLGPARRTRPGRQRVDQRLDDVREVRLEAQHEDPAEHEAAEHRLVD